MGPEVVVAVLAAGVVLLIWFGRWGERWGATPEELDARLPGDEWLDGGPPASVRMTRAIWIDAPPEQVWPWIAQMGRGAGWYSYDRLDNGGRRSANHIVSWIPEPKLGDAAAIGYLRHLEPGRELAWWIGNTSFFGASARSVMFYRVAADGDRTRLLVRMQAGARGATARFALWAYRIIDTVMARRQLLGIKERAESSEARDGDETGARDEYQLYHAIYASGGEAGVPGREEAARWHQAAIEDGVIDIGPALAPRTSLR
jgi:hypothetical protein